MVHLVSEFELGNLLDSLAEDKLRHKLSGHASVDQGFASIELYQLEQPSALPRMHRCRAATCRCSHVRGRRLS